MNIIALKEYRDLAQHLADTLKPGEYNQNHFCFCFVGHIRRISGEIGWVYKLFKECDLSNDETVYITSFEWTIKDAAKTLNLPTPTDFTAKGLVERIDNIIGLHEGESTPEA